MSRFLLLAVMVGLVVWIGPATGVSAQNDVLIVGHTLDPSTLNPWDTVSANEVVFAQIVEKLITFEVGQAVPQPWLATGWRWVDDKTLEVDLRRNVTFSNGEPFDARAAKFSIEQLMKADRYIKFTTGMLKGVEVVGSHRIRLSIFGRGALLIYTLAKGSFMVPPRLYTEMGAAKFNLAPVGTGPFVLKEWIKGSRLVLDRNPTYWRGPHPARQAIFRVIPEDASRVAAVQAGDIDIALMLPITHLNRLKADRNLTISAIPGLRKFAAFFNNTDYKGPQADRRVRVAMNLAVDKDTIVRRVFAGQAQVIQGQWLLPFEFGFNPGVKPFPYDTARAKRLLAEAGYPNGFETQLTYTVGRYAMDQELGEIVASYLEAVGIRVRQRPLEFGEFIRLYSLRQLGPIHQWGTLSVPVTHMTYSIFSRDGGTHRFYDFPLEWDRLMNAAADESDAKRQLDIYYKMAQMQYEDPFGLYLIAPNDVYAVRKRIQGFVPPFDQVPRLADVKFAN